MKRKIIKHSSMILIWLIPILLLFSCDIKFVGSPYYTVNFYVDGVIIKTEEVKLHFPAQAPETPLKQGYTFTGWSKDFSKIEGDLDVHAIYEIINYSITYINDGSEINNPNTYTILDEITLNLPSKEGYNFIGWYQDDVLINTIPLGSTGEKTLIARYVAIKYQYQVEYYLENIDDDNYTLDHIDTLSGTINEEVNALIKNIDGFTFNNEISIIKGDVSVDESLVLKVYYTRNLYTLIIDENGGNDVNDIIAKYGATFMVVEPVKEGYTFTGWLPEVPLTMPLNGAIVSATWAPAMVNYYVEHYFENVNNNNYSLYQTDTIQALTNSIVDATLIDVLGFSNTLHELEVKTGTVLADGTLVLKLFYIRNIYRIIMDLDGGMGPTFIEAKHGTTITAPVVTKEDYTFNCWEPSFPSVMPIGGANVKAIWTKIPVYTLSFDTFGGSIIEDQYVIENTQATIPNNPIKIGYAFVYWYLNDSNIPFDFNSLITENITLYALWEALEVDYQVEYYQENIDNDDYTLIETSLLKGITEQSVSALINTYQGFEYYREHELSKTEGIVLADGSLVLSVYYKRVLTTITIDASGGIANPISITAKYGALVTEPSIEKEGFEFDGWVGYNEFPTIMPFDNITITAKWKAINYPITYFCIYNDEVITDVINQNPISYTILESITLIPVTFSKPHYTFEGWFLDEALTIATTGITSGATGAITFYGKVATSINMATLDKEALILEYQSVLTGNITDLFDLRVVGENGSDISWQSSSTAVFVNNQTGKVTITQSTIESIQITLTAIITHNDVEYDFALFTFVVPRLILPKYSDDLENHDAIAYADTSTNIAGLEWNTKEVHLSIPGDGSDLTSANDNNKRMLRFRGADVACLELKDALSFISRITFDAKYYNDNHSAAVMKLSKQVAGGDWVVVATIPLTASYQTFSVDINEYNVKIRIDVTSKSANLDNINIYDIELTDEEKIAQDKIMLEALSGDINQGDIFNLISTGMFGSNITWQASPTGLIDELGIVGASLSESTTLTLTATLSINDATTTAIITLNIIVIPDSIKIQSDLAEISNDLGEKAETFALLTSFTNGSNVIWTVKSGSSIIIVDNVITVFNQPTDQDEIVTLTATLTLNNETVSKDVTVIVLKKIIGLELAYHFDFGTKQVIGYSATKTHPITNLVDNSSLDIIGHWTQITTSSTDPHKDAGAFAVMCPTRVNNETKGAYLQFSLGETVRKITFDLSWWSSSDASSHASKLEKLEVQVSNNGTDWTSLGDIKSQLDASKYTTISFDGFEAQYVRIFALADKTYASNQNLRLTVDNVKIFK